MPRLVPAQARWDLTALLKNPLVENSSVHFNAKDVYNFGLEKNAGYARADEEVQEEL